MHVYTASVVEISLREKHLTFLLYTAILEEHIQHVLFLAVSMQQRITKKKPQKNSNIKIKKKNRIPSALWVGTHFNVWKSLYMQM